MAEFTTKFEIGDRVVADFDETCRFTVTGFTFRLSREPLVELSYFHNGESKTAWVESFRLRKDAA